MRAWKADSTRSTMLSGTVNCAAWLVTEKHVADTSSFCSGAK